MWYNISWTEESDVFHRQLKNGNIISSERSYGSVSRQYRLPNVDRDEIKASYKNGVLSINLPKLQVDQKSDSQIEID